MCTTTFLQYSCGHEYQGTTQSCSEYAAHQKKYRSLPGWRRIPPLPDHETQDTYEERKVMCSICLVNGPPKRPTRDMASGDDGSANQPQEVPGEK